MGVAQRRAIKLIRLSLGLPTDDLDIVGRLDGCRDGVVHGWAYRPAHPRLRVLVDIFADDVFVCRRSADMPRDDLAAHGIGDGRHGFDVAIPATFSRGAETKIRVYAVAETPLELTSTEARALFVRRLGRDDYLRATFATAFASREHETAEASTPRAAQTLHTTELLFAPTSVPAPPPILGEALCAYLDHNRYKWDLADKFDATISIADREAFLAHYVEFYGRARRPLRIPLSARDIEFLNDGPTAGDRFAPSRAMRLFAEAPPERATEAERLDAIFRWAAFSCAAFNVEDCLVAEAHAQLLRSCEDHYRFPLSAFMKRFLDAHPLLRRMNIATEADRRAAYFAMLLFAARAPHYLSFIPRDWLEAFLSPQQDGVAPFDEESRRLFGTGGVEVSGWRASIDALGYDDRAKRFRSRTPSGHRAHAVTLPAPEGETVDIQLIGPFSRQLGIADSCRALAAALERLDHSVRLCDFTLDYPNRIRSDAAPLSTTPGRAKINILHLNLEELPSAIAYLPDVWSDSRTVAFPYLEMPTPHPAQMLGLTLVDELWSASDFTTQALSGHRPTFTVGTSRRSLRKRGREAARSLVYGDFARADDFVFLASCDALSGVYRKNPLGTMRAFLAAFPKEARVKLVIKTHSVDRVRATREMDVWRSIRNVVEECDRIILVDRILDDDEQMALIEGADCYVSLHRAEGFGYHMLEAMTLETPVIATAYSGNMEFCDDRTAFLVPYRLVPVGPGEYPRTRGDQLWAEPNFADSVEAMQTVFADRKAREAKIAAARTLAETRFSTEAFAQRLDARIKTILGRGA
ncbi:glycosyltransferase [Methylosinus sp. H3A]|uniref:glycosyltransferase n=1 Tax=Methylosinus sp. H3A TaxID=2785786 RepID=UPI001AEDD8CB|nr:glycosyltransferase [Methylosinus sp. H3A]